MTEEQLTALLRLKRFEQPPPGYFDRLLQDVHRSQREELLHRSLWSIAAERVQTFFSAHSMGSLSYAGAMAAALVVGVGMILVMTPGPIESSQTALVALDPPKLRAGSLLTLGASPRLALPVRFEISSFPSMRAVSTKDRRYVIDASPVTVSYEPESPLRF